MFYKYQHVANDFNSQEVAGLLDSAEIIIQPKLDGSNCQVWMENGELIVSSRNKVLSLEQDNQGCYQYFCKPWIKKKFMQFFTTNPTVKLVGEWLVPHKIKYIKEAYNNFIVFDGVFMSTESEAGNPIYVDYPLLSDVLLQYSIDHVSYMVMNNPDISSIKKLFKTFCRFFNYLVDVKNNHKTCEGEGLVVKNYSYSNRFGRSTWCKLINEEFYNLSNTKKPKEKIDRTQEIEFVESKCIDHLLSKCFYKLENDKHMEEYIKLCQNEFVEDYDCTGLSLKTIRNIVAKKAVQFWREVGTDEKI